MSLFRLMASMDQTSLELALDQVFELFEQFGQEDYLGESVSKIVHSVQCGMLAENEGYAVPVILGAFFHDIGHLEGERRGNKQMIYEGTNLGISNHAALGAEYLKEKGFPSMVTDIVAAHVNAKRYLSAVDKDYYDKLSWASKGTLGFQGGPMNEVQVKRFESNPQHQIFIKMRTWDEKAKDQSWKDLKPLSYFREMALNYLRSLQK